MEGTIRIEEAESKDANFLAQLSKEAFHSDSIVFGFESPGGPPGYDSPKSQI